MARISKSV
ncbi:hypothetical protein D021_1224A, partial [Vibrio parahaemolyticus 10296]